MHFATIGSLVRKARIHRPTATKPVAYALGNSIHQHVDLTLVHSLPCGTTPM